MKRLLNKVECDGNIGFGLCSTYFYSGFDSEKEKILPEETLRVGHEVSAFDLTVSETAKYRNWLRVYTVHKTRKGFNTSIAIR